MIFDFEKKSDDLKVKLAKQNSQSKSPTLWTIIYPYMNLQII